MRLRGMLIAEHGFVIPLGMAALLILAGIVAIVGAGVKWKIDR